MDKDKLILKLEEYSFGLKGLLQYYISENEMKKKCNKLESEIASLKSEVESEKPGCLSCGEPISQYCERCKHLWES